MSKVMVDDKDSTLCCSSILLGNGSLLIDGTLVVSLPGIIEMLFPTPKLQNLDLLINDDEWIVPKYKPRGGYKVDFVPSTRIRRPPNSNVCQKEIEKDVAQGK